MRKWLLGLVLISTLAFNACTGNGSPFVTLEAQSLPITKTFAWDAGAGADSYIVRLDATQIGTPTGLTQTFTITTLGPHSLSAQSVNMWGVSSVVTLNFNVVLPGAPTNGRIQ